MITVQRSSSQLYLAPMASLNVASGVGSGQSDSAVLRRIKDLIRGQKLVNLLSVVVAFRAPAKSRGKDYSCMLQLVDESEDEIKCLLFGSESELPRQCPLGSVVLLKKVEVTEYQNRPQLVAKSRLSTWAILSEKDDAAGSMSVSFSNDHCLSLSEAECKRGKDLKIWADSTNLISEYQTGLSSSAGSTTHGLTSGTSMAPTSLPSDSAPSTSAGLHVALPVGGRVFPPSSRRNYGVEIKTIGQLSAGMKDTGVCGIVKHFKPPAKSKGRDYYTVIHLVDESSPSCGVTCIIFNPSLSLLAAVGSVGSVALIKGLRVESNRETSSLQVLGHEHSLVGLFTGDISVDIPDQIGTWYKLKSHEKKRIEELRVWSEREGALLLSTKFEDMLSGHYFNMVCVVAAMAVVEECRLAVLSVLDGTVTKTNFNELNIEHTRHDWIFDADPELFYKYRDFTQDIWVSNVDQLDADAGSVVKLTNVYSLRPSTTLDVHSESSALSELRVTGQDRGAVVLLDDTSRESMDLKASLPIVEIAVPVWRKPTNLDDSQNEDENDERMVIRTTVDESTPLATLKQVMEDDVGAEYLADVEVVMVSPGTVGAFCSPYCPKCRQKVEVEASGVTVCEKDGTVLEYSLDFSLHLRDTCDCSELTVHVGNDEARKLFSNVITNSGFVANQETKDSILNILYAITGGNDPFFPLPPDPRYCYTRPILRCAIKKPFEHSPSSHDEMSCQTTIFDLVNTVICELDSLHC